MYTVYMHICPNNKKYIGITGQEVERRWNHGEGYSHQRLFYRAILKYGWNNIEHKIIKTNLDKLEAENIEKSLIEKYNTTNSDFGYNITKGGDGGALGVSPSKETRQKLSKASKKSWQTKERREKQRYVNCKKVIQYDLDGNVIEKFDSVKSACEKLNCFGVSACCKRKQKTCKGYVFRFEGDTFEKPEKYVITEEHRKNLSNAIKKAYQDPEYVASHNAGLKKCREKLSESVKKLWQNDDYRKKNLEARRHYNGKNL